MQVTNLGVLSLQLEISEWVCRGKITDGISQVKKCYHFDNWVLVSLTALILI